MKSYDEMEFHPVSEQLVNLMCNKTQSKEPLFFRISIAYYWAMLSSMMGCEIQTYKNERGRLPTNLYAINLAPSGFGKGYSTNLMEEEVINQFRHNFTEEVFPLLAQKNIPTIAYRRAAKNQTDPDNELSRAQKEFDSLGPLVFTFDSGTTAAVKQARHKLLMAGAGSLNLQMDEAGSNILGNQEVLNTYLELYDMGKVKQKLLKNTSDNLRFEEIHGKTPTNMMLFGAPVRLLNGGKEEAEFHVMLDTGYARRCFFGYVKHNKKLSGMSAEDILDQRTNGSSVQFLEQLSDRLGDLADLALVGQQLQVSRDVALLFIEYEQRCVGLAEKLGAHQEMLKAELTHRYFKAMKLAGAYAFIDGCPEITEEHAYYAIKLAEESGRAFEAILAQDKPHVKLAKYIADIRKPVTQVDLMSDLPFFKGPQSQRNDIMQLAIAYGYQNNIIIRKQFTDGIEFISGETLKKTDLGNMIFSWSEDISKDYTKEPKPVHFDDLHKLTQIAGIHWCSHTFLDGHRKEDAAIPGFNMLVLDVDGTVNLSTAKMLLAGYKAMFYTTKRHGVDGKERFRVILPMNYVLELSAKDHKEFWDNVFAWLPFEVDTASAQRSRKWLSHPGYYEYQEGALVDVLPFIPKTSKNEDFKKQSLDQQGMDNLERWVVNNTGDGNRNNQVLRFALVLTDAGFDFDSVLQRVKALNEKLTDPLEESEILGTIMRTVAKKQAA